MKSHSLEVIAHKVTMDAPVEIAAGKTFDVSWQGPNASGDLIFVAPKNMADSKYRYSGNKSIRTKDMKTGQLIAPAKTGDYEIRYYSYNNGDVLARFPIKVVNSNATLKAPRMAEVGTEIEVEWTVD